MKKRNQDRRHKVNLNLLDGLQFHSHCGDQREHESSKDDFEYFKEWRHKLKIDVELYNGLQRELVRVHRPIS